MKFNLKRNAFFIGMSILLLGFGIIGATNSFFVNDKLFIASIFLFAIGLLVIVFLILERLKKGRESQK